MWIDTLLHICDIAAAFSYGTKVQISGNGLSSPDHDGICVTRLAS